MSTRDAVWAEINARCSTDRDRMAAWMATDLIAMIPDDEWQAMHAGTCGLCGADGARLYAAGFRCDAHLPATPRFGSSSR